MLHGFSISYFFCFCKRKAGTACQFSAEMHIEAYQNSIWSITLLSAFALA